MDIKLQNYEKIEDLSVIQNMLCDLMQELHNLCEEHGLVYNLFGGSLLGAVRHQDMIPWDDDIDVMMPRPDYEKLISIIENNPSDKYCIYTDKNSNYIYPYAKFCRKDTVLIERIFVDKVSEIKLYIDVFPLDGIPESEDETRKLYARAKRYKDKHNASLVKLTVSPVWWKKPYVVYRWLRRTVKGIRGYKYYLKKMNEITKTHSFEDCDNVGFISNWVYGAKAIASKKEFYDRKLYKFGKYEFWGVRDYDKALTKLYGDYMTPPPIEKRKTHHTFDLYIKK